MIVWIILRMRAGSTSTGERDPAAPLSSAEVCQALVIPTAPRQTAGTYERTLIVSPDSERAELAALTGNYLVAG
jgi:hypothetical protein